MHAQMYHTDFMLIFFTNKCSVHKQSIIFKIFSFYTNPQSKVISYSIIRMVKLHTIVKYKLSIIGISRIFVKGCQTISSL